MKIVVEYVLIENFLINLIILKTVELILKEKGRLFFLTSLLLSTTTVILPLFKLFAWGNFLLEWGMMIFVVCISFKFKTFKKFAQIYLMLFVVSLLYGGACFFWQNLFGIQSAIVVLAVIVFVFFVVGFLARKRHRKDSLENFCFDVEIENKGKTTKWKGFLDSGNLLYDPLTESPVCLINYKVFASLFEEINLEDVLRKTEKIKRLKFAHYINFNTLNNSDKILVFQVDVLKIGNISNPKAILGLSLKNFNEAFGSDIILHNNFACASS